MLPVVAGGNRVYYRVLSELQDLHECGLRERLLRGYRPASRVMMVRVRSIGMAGYLRARGQAGDAGGFRIGL